MEGDCFNYCVWGKNRGGVGGGRGDSGLPRAKKFKQASGRRNLGVSRRKKEIGGEMLPCSGRKYTRGERR